RPGAKCILTGMRRHGLLPPIAGFGALIILAAALWREHLPRHHLPVASRAFRAPNLPPSGSAIPQRPGVARHHNPHVPGAPLPLDRHSPLRPATDAERQAAIASIDHQLRAFRTGDYERAIFYQSTLLRQNFTSAEGFRRMMERRYPEF